MNKIRIVNWLLTRQCNLKCDYCAIVKNYKNKPSEYPDMEHYIKNQMSTDDIMMGLGKFKQHNPDCFHILYGGEPFLRKDIPSIIDFCNINNIHYTIITNNTDIIQPQIERLFDIVGTVKGLTSSVDPVFNRSKGLENQPESTSDRVKKSVSGLKNLLKYKDRVDDLVAEITVMRDNVEHLYDLVRELSDNGINSDITFIDIAKNPYYDFADISEPWELVYPSATLANQFQKIHEDKSLDIHMKDFLLKKIWDILPSHMDCEIDKELHNITIDADGSIRLCLRIRGIVTPEKFNVHNLFDNKGIWRLEDWIGTDKKNLCQLCNHTCQLMSKYGDKVDELVHLNKRGGK